VIHHFRTGVRLLPALSLVATFVCLVFLIEIVGIMTRLEVLGTLAIDTIIGLRPEMTTDRFEQANEAFCDLRTGQAKGTNLRIVATQIGCRTSYSRNCFQSWRPYASSQLSSPLTLAVATATLVSAAP